MKQQLTLEHIAWYQNLKWYNKKSGNINESTGYYITTDGSLVITDGEYFKNFELWPIKPILFPMSDLTKKVIIAGEEIVPIVELAKIGWDEKLSVYEVHPERARLITNWKSLIYPEARYISFNCKTWENNNFYLGVLDSEINEIHYLCPRNQNKLFKWLYAHSFDVDGLIESGLAMDVNTLENNVYNE